MFRSSHFAPAFQVIRDSQSENKVEASDKLHIRAQLPKSIENESPGGVTLPPTLVPLHSHLGNTTDGPYVKILVRLYLSYSSDKPATQVSLTIDAPGSFHIVPKNILLAKVSGVKSTPLMVKVFFYATRNNLPTTLDAVVTASYVSHSGEPRVTSIPLVSFPSTPFLVVFFCIDVVMVPLQFHFVRMYHKLIT